jgi:hypothetical protein
MVVVPIRRRSATCAVSRRNIALPVFAGVDNIVGIVFVRTW